MKRRITKRGQTSLIESLETRRLMTVTPDPGADFNTAYNVGTLLGATGFSDHVGPSDISDIYKFTVLKNGTFNGRLRVYNAAADFSLFQKTSAGQILFVQTITANTTGPDAGYNSGDFTKFLTAGDYFLSVDSRGSETDYLIRMTPDYAGNSLSSARDTGMATEAIFNDFVGNFDVPSLTDASDYYKLKMDADGVLFASYGHSAGFTDTSTFLSHMDVIKDANNNGVVDSGEVLGTTPVSNGGAVIVNVTKGTYFVRVVTDKNYQNYQLRINADYAPNSIGQFRDVSGSMNNGGLFTDWIADPNDRWDNYSFTLTQSRPFYASFNEAGGASAVVSLYRDSNGNNKIDSSELVESSSNASSAVMVEGLVAGKYFVQVGSPVGKGVYTLYMQTKPDAAGNTLGAAKNLGTVNGLASYQDEYITRDDRDDFYKFSLSAAGSITATLNSYIGLNPSLSLIKDNNGNGVVDSSDTLATSAEPLSRLHRLSKTLAQGTYFLRVGVGNVFNLRSPTAGRYTLSFFTDYAGNDTAHARSLGTLAGTKNFDDYATQNYGAGSDQYDFYKFSLSSSKAFSAKMIGTLSGEDLDMQLYQDKNNDGQISSNEIVAVSAKKNSPNETINKTIGKGTYFLRIYGVNGDTNYHLTMKA